MNSTGLVPKSFKHSRHIFWRAAEWQPFYDRNRDYSETTDITELRIGTLNRWFETRHAKERNDSMIGTLDKLKWDVFCLQEATQGSILHAANHPVVQQKWVVSDSMGDTLPRGNFHGLLTMYNPETVEVITIHNRALPNSMQRRYYQVSIVRLHSKAKRKSVTRLLRIINVHLESPTYSNLASDARAEQLRHLHSVTQEPYNDALIPTVVIGDLNLVSPGEGTTSDALFTDMWTMLRPHEKGHTWPSPYHKQDVHPSSRPDRILASDTDCLKPVEINIVFEQPVHVDQFGDVPLSDHSGLLARISIQPCKGTNLSDISN